jgi:hypothetical protein
VVFGFLKILSIILNVTAPPPQGVNERCQHNYHSCNLVYLGNRKSTNGQRPTRCYCACTIVFHSSIGAGGWQ